VKKAYMGSLINLNIKKNISSLRKEKKQGLFDDDILVLCDVSGSMQGMPFINLNKAISKHYIKYLFSFSDFFYKMD